MTYKLEFASRAAREFRKLPPQEQQRISVSIDRLIVNPYPPGSQKVQGHSDLFRIRVGNYRVIYDIQDDILIVLVVRIGHRRDVYRNMDEL